MNTSIHCHLHHYLTKYVFSLMNRDMIPQITLLAGKPIQACSHFQQHCQWKVDPHCAFRCRHMGSNMVRHVPNWFYLHGVKLNFSVICWWWNKWLVCPQSKQLPLWWVRELIVSSEMLKRLENVKNQGWIHVYQILNHLDLVITLDNKQ